MEARTDATPTEIVNGRPFIMRLWARQDATVSAMRLL